MHVNRKTAIVLAFIAGMAVVLTSGVLLQRQSEDQPQPTALDNRSYPVYVPRSDSGLILDSANATFDVENTVLTTNITLQDGTTVVLTQQPTPEVFADVPQQYSKMLALLNQYKEIKSEFGTIALTRPKELNGGQSGVVNRPGTLLFVKPGRDLTDQEWKTFFSSLVVYK